MDDEEEIDFYPLNFYDVVSRNWVSVDEDDDSNEEFFPHLFSYQLNQKKSKPINVSVHSRISPREHWKLAARKALHLADPWKEFHLENLQCQKAIRYRFNALKQNWVKDEVQVKMSKESFSHGAMRECFRIKKLSNFTHNHDWKNASNYVAKRYMSSVSREVYLEDVKLQMEAKLWSEEYNRHNPPKKVDIMQVCVLELSDQPGSPLYHLEHFIEGDYVKYNSNSGFISCENVRLTPQAFSHFTFEQSGHDLIVVDIQGVGDLYTDPQIHTSCGTGYGEGNLGTRGMALFFKSHVCNHICHALNLTPFDLSEVEKNLNNQVSELLKSCKTEVKTNGDGRPKPFVFKRSDVSLDSAGSVEDYEFKDSEDSRKSLEPGSESPDSGVESSIPRIQKPHSRIRYESESSFENTEEDRFAFQRRLAVRSRPSAIHLEAEQVLANIIASGQRCQKPILGQIHLDLVSYYEQGRFSTELSITVVKYDVESALFHLQKAADCGCLEAIITLYSFHFDLDRNHLVGVKLPITPNVDHGVDFLTRAAILGDRASMIVLAKIFDTGEGLGVTRQRSWKEAVKWYKFAVAVDDSEDNDSLSDSNFQLLARQAEIYKEGGYGVDINLQLSGDLFTQAGELAMSAMKGRLANQFFALAEEAWSQMDSS